MSILVFVVLSLWGAEQLHTKLVYHLLVVSNKTLIVLLCETHQAIYLAGSHLNLHLFECNLVVKTETCVFTNVCVSPVMISTGVRPTAYFELETDILPFSHTQIEPKSHNRRGTCFFDMIWYHLCLISRIEPSDGFSFGRRRNNIWYCISYLRSVFINNVFLPDFIAAPSNVKWSGAPY